MKFKILIIDDDNLVCNSLKKILVKFDYDVETCFLPEEAEKNIRFFGPDVILLDIYLTTANGLDLLKSFKKLYSHIPIIMITGYSDVKTAVTAMKLGAYDFLLKPIDMDQLKLVLSRSMENIALRSEVNKLSQLMEGDKLTREFFGKSRKIASVLNLVEKYAGSPDTTILIEGESGTGKEEFAKYIHQNSPRCKSPFVQINCAAIPKELAESELFGHEKGAFTGASSKTKLGKFELANEGTLLLDEIGELTPDLQVKLLRVLQEKRFYRVGGEKEISVNVRVIAATNKNLEEEVQNGNFREDLYYRLNVAKILLPPLRERVDDIPYLSLAFLKEFASKLNKGIRDIQPDAINILKSYSWKGNIRELRNLIERVALLIDEEEVKPYHLINLLPSGNNDVQNGKFSMTIPHNGVKMDTVIKDLILKTLNITNGNQVQAAKILGLSRSKLRYRMEQLKIEVTKKIK